MKKSFLILPVLFLFLVFNSFSGRQDTKDGIQFFQGSWQEALQKSANDHKLIFLDLSTSWCGWCKKMRQTTYVEKKVGSYFNDTFICMELDGEHGEGKRLAQKFHATGYPALYLINSNEEPMLSSEGYHPPEDLMKLVKSVVKPEK